jgi:light-independent protochlorophyllide reductase subunit B
MFRGDFEFHEDAAPSHLGGHGSKARAAAEIEAAHVIAAAAAVEVPPPVPAATAPSTEVAPTAAPAAADAVATWAPDAEKELRKIPFFVRGKARRNTEKFAQEQGVPVITIETLYDAKAHFSR